jgi:hypothetical protein
MLLLLQLQSISSILNGNIFKIFSSKQKTEEKYVPTASCAIASMVAVPSYGFHPRLAISFDIHNLTGLPNLGKHQVFYSLILFFHFPSSLFFDIRMLKIDLMRQSKDIKVIHVSHMDLSPETFAEEESNSILGIEIFIPIKNSKNFQYSLNVSFPLHIRYHIASAEDYGRSLPYVNVKINEPSFYIKSTDNKYSVFNQSEHDDTFSSAEIIVKALSGEILLLNSSRPERHKNIDSQCLSFQTNCSKINNMIRLYKTSNHKHRNRSVTIEIPVGRIQDYTLVSNVTFVVNIILFVALLVALVM